jgi:hypothetical protein
MYNEENFREFRQLDLIPLVWSDHVGVHAGKVIVDVVLLLVRISLFMLVSLTASIDRIRKQVASDYRIRRG